MTWDIYDPLTEYASVFSKRFREIAESTFERLAKEAAVDTAANKATCKKLYEAEHLYDSAQDSIGSWRLLSGLMWAVIIISVIVFFALIETLPFWGFIALACAVVGAILVLTTLSGPKIKKLKEEQDRLAPLIASLKEEAWAQMAPLNRLYDWDLLTRMMVQTVPRLEFDPYFTTQRLADLQQVYGWDDSFNEGKSVLFSHSGLINGNPFVIVRARDMVMGRKTYTGSKTIYWTTTERDANGRYRTVQHSQTLTATVTAPYPEYPENTWLIYGNTAAPDLIFNRYSNGLAGEEGTGAHRRALRRLRRQARDLEGGDFALMTNEDFEVAFNTSDRNNNQQFALLFTPLAQESMLKLLRDRQWGYGDDFNFHKNRMINTINAQHLQRVSLDLNPDQFKALDFEQARANFLKVSAEHFRAVYFGLAPLLCVPMYQQIRSQEDIYGRDMRRESAFWEHEALANFWGQDRFMHPSCVTNCILKTSVSNQHPAPAVRSAAGAAPGAGAASAAQAGTAAGAGFPSGAAGATSATAGGGAAAGATGKTITVYAHGHRSEHRVSHISRLGGDGRWHDVPVHWEEYFPVTGTGTIKMQEDNTTEAADTSKSQTDRLNYINSVLEKAGLDVYRRHIASKVL